MIDSTSSQLPHTARTGSKLLSLSSPVVVGQWGSVSDSKLEQPLQQSHIDAANFEQSDTGQSRSHLAVITVMSSHVLVRRMAVYGEQTFSLYCEDKLIHCKLNFD